MTNWHPGWEIGGIVDLEKQIFSHFVSLCENLKISNPVIIFAYQQSFKVLLRFVNKMLGAELYQIDFMGRESKLNCWTTFLKYQNKWTSNSSFLHVFTLSVIEISKSLTLFLFFNAKRKVLGYRGRIIHRVLYTKNRTLSLQNL